MIDVKFDGEEFPNVTTVQPSDTVSRTSIIDKADLLGARVRNVIVNGYIKKRPKDELATLQKTFTKTFAEKGEGIIEYPGVEPYTARVTSIDWEEWTGNPIIRYTVTLEAEFTNPFSKSVVVSESGGGDSITFDPIPSVADSYKNTNPIDEAPSATKDKQITLDGKFAGRILVLVRAADESVSHFPSL